MDRALVSTPPWPLFLAVCLTVACSDFREGPLNSADAGTVVADVTVRQDAGRCDGGVCPRAQGDPCAANSECPTGFCVDGVCCNAACVGQCEACDGIAPGTGPGTAPGTCAAVTGVPHGTRAACTGTGACAQTCTGTDRVSCVLPPGSTCPRCGDGMCSPGETCSSCRTDCGPCAISCQTCTMETDCPTGMHCARRSCDGTLGCLQGTGGPACMDIAGLSCPTVGAYQHCTRGSMECGPSADCTSFPVSRPPLCERRCTRTAECPDAPVGFPQVTATCDMNIGVCYLECPGPGTCPFGLTCLTFIDGSYGYCD